MTLEDIDRRLRAIEDIEEIKRLKARYCSYCDDNYDADSIASLFTEDAIWDGGIRGSVEGRDEIRNFFIRASQRLPFTVHMVMNPIIEVDGDRAKGIWYLFQIPLATGSHETSLLPKPLRDLFWGIRRLVGEIHAGVACLAWWLYHRC